MVKLLPLILSVSMASASADSCAGTMADQPGLQCNYCGAPAGRAPSSLGDVAAIACSLCRLAQHLERPRINEEARLIWLPEMSQAALNVLMRRIHSGLRGLGERLETDVRPSLAVGERTLLYHGQQALLVRAREAEVRLGTSDPAELADALLRLSSAAVARRDALLGGVRILPMGRLFEGSEDIYPAIVDSWRQTAGHPPGGTE